MTVIFSQELQSLVITSRGPRGYNTIYEYSEDTTSWHATYTMGVDFYYRTSTDNGGTYGNAIPIGGIVTTFLGSGD